MINSHVLCLNRVRSWQKAKAPPGEIEAVVVVGNIDGAQVPGLVDEEVQHVECVEGS